MTVGKLNHHFDDLQVARARSALNSVKGLYETTDNSCTYAMTGLLEHLLKAIVNGEVLAESYLREKCELILGCVER